MGKAPTIFHSGLPQYIPILLIAAIVYMLFRKNKYDNNTLTVTAKKAKSKATK